MFGYIVAKFYNKLGYKPWIFVGNILNAVFMTACFSTHYFEGTTQIVYLTIVYIAWGMSYTICDAPFWSLIPNITAAISTFCRYHRWLYCLRLRSVCRAPLRSRR